MEKYEIDNEDKPEIFPIIDIISYNKGEMFFEEVEKEIQNARKEHKQIQYYSDNLIIYSLEDDINLGHTITIFEIVHRNRKDNKVECSYLANKKLHGQYLLNLINKAELEK